MRLLPAAAGLTGAIMLAAGQPVLAASPPPVSVAACDYSSYEGDAGQLIPATAPFRTSNLRLTFVNNAAGDVPAPEGPILTPPRRRAEKTHAGAPALISL